MTLRFLGRQSLSWLLHPRKVNTFDAEMNSFAKKMLTAGCGGGYTGSLTISPARFVSNIHGGRVGYSWFVGDDGRTAMMGLFLVEGDTEVFKLP